MDDLPIRAIQFHSNLPHDVGPVMNRVTLCGLLVDVDLDEEYLQIPVHLERRDAHNC